MDRFRGYLQAGSEMPIRESAVRTPSLHEAFRAYAPQLRRLGYLITGSTEMAEDLVQDAFVRFFTKPTRLRDPHATLSYLRRSVVHLSYSRFRRLRLERSYRTTISRQPEVVLPDVEGRDELLHALLELPRRQRIALVLRYCEDLSEGEVADFLDSTPKAVKSLITRGLSGLRAHLEVEDE